MSQRETSLTGQIDLHFYTIYYFPLKNKQIFYNSTPKIFIISLFFYYIEIEILTICQNLLLDYNYSYIFLSISGNNCFFLETTPGKNALLFSSFTSNAFSTASVLSPKAIISELLFKMSVIANTNN